MDHYSTLGVNKDATPDEIKKAFRKLASQHHPDKGGDTAKFQEIQVAYDTLSDPDKKAQYDNPNTFGTRTDGGWQQAGPGGFPPGFEDLFSSMFGANHNPFGFHSPRQAVRNRTLNIQTTISLNDAFSGKDLMANIGLPSGREQTVEIKIPAGILDGTVLRLAGMGDDSVSGVPRGDIHLAVNVAPHSKFQRQGDDLVYNYEINGVEAMLGKVVYIDTIDGKTLEMSIPAGAQHGTVMAANGYGMPKMNDNRFKGRLLINVSVRTLTNLTDQQKQTLVDIFK